MGPLDSCRGRMGSSFLGAALDPSRLRSRLRPAHVEFDETCALGVGASSGSGAFWAAWVNVAHHSGAIQPCSWTRAAGESRSPGEVQTQRTVTWESHTLDGCTGLAEGALELYGSHRENHALSSIQRERVKVVKEVDGRLGWLHGGCCDRHAVSHALARRGQEVPKVVIGRSRRSCNAGRGEMCWTGHARQVAPGLRVAGGEGRAGREAGGEGRAGLADEPRGSKSSSLSWNSLALLRELHMVRR